MLVVSICTPQN